MNITGECFCGSVRYQIKSPLRDARSCHCSRCRKAFSAQASAYALVDADQFEWLQGEELLSAYVTNGGFGLKFCSRCGSTLCGTFQGRVHGITLGCLNDDPQLRIEKHIFMDSKATWETQPEEVESYLEHAPMPV
ncbi:MAG: GFA family protein [Cyanobacteria bacterium P01_H01_bin.21]